MGETRRHHYVPQSYLALFTPSGRKDDRLHVLDLREGRQWKALPDKVAHEHDFYRVNVSGMEPNMVEDWFSEFEAEAAPVLRYVDERKELPKGKAYETLMAFVALQASRTRRIRDTMASGMEQVSKMSLRLIFQSEDRWNMYKERMKREGFGGEDLDEVTYEQMIDFLRRDNFTISPGDTFLTRTNVESWQTLIPMVQAREWSVVVAPEGESFICSEEPVSLVSTVELPDFWSSPGFGMRNTELTMPVSKSVMLVGRFQQMEPVVTTDRHGMAALNSRTGMYAERWIFSPYADFSWLRKDGKVGNVNDLLQLVRGERQKRPPER
ncbi:MAG TPA: DUF4238 domain-containing protein [Symbiobacteriaceae bacterium]|nr:DUF4238 domain-containing protein [Symbiobacteriaceae bacterium]